MQITLTGKVAVVTGAAQGIGRAIAKQFAACGADVVVNDIDEQRIATAVAAIKAEIPGAKVRGAAADLSTAAGCDRLVTQVPDCDILVNNAAIFETADFFDIPDATWQRYFDVNLMSGIRLSRAYLPAMGKRDWGRVVFISSECGISTPPDMLHYTMTKTALLGISRGLAKRMAGTGVTVNAVLPGPTLSEGVQTFLEAEIRRTGKTIEEQGAELVNALRPSSITRRFQSVDEVANLVLYTCSPLASATTGAALRADGGVADTPI
ncbi:MULTISPECIES: SDR family NAD(P)-dependent oxidoreductase [Burkholderia]|jgi:NAD(P)-dependent dehydrogenase (short-subunit alcohol dehydrogenase family)|uniref:SDR family NAD(P)-dependent oxidoreductase n=1 Tax=Burkholderia TaxID=32008 RepID=UPI001454B626|nr:MULTISPECIES: SDR family oxidoreductase [Burkholderia]MBN3768072.1 SDR family oxidoreductase [Burkholderia sp. Se-20378]VWB42612.1 oxidoreductase [Burkholderia lata]VWL86541.1 oxidoreductase [Burkholderia lata]